MGFGEGAVEDRFEGRPSVGGEGDAGKSRVHLPPGVEEDGEDAFHARGLEPVDEAVGVRPSHWPDAMVPGDAHGWPPIFARMRTGAEPWGLNISCPFSGEVPQRSRSWKEPLFLGGRAWRAGAGVRDFDIESPFCVVLADAITKEGEEAPPNPVEAPGVDGRGLVGRLPEPEALARETRGLDREVVAHIRVLEFLLQDLEALHCEGAEPLLNSAANRGVDEFVPPILEPNPERIARENEADPALRIPERGRQFPLANPRLRDQEIHHRVVRVAELFRSPAWGPPVPELIPLLRAFEGGLGGEVVGGASGDVSDGAARHGDDYMRGRAACQGRGAEMLGCTHVSWRLCAHTLKTSRKM